MTRARQAQSPNLKSALWEAALAVVVMLTLPGPIAAGADQLAAFVSAQACAGCHTAQFDAWKGSHHALAMQPATTATMLGDFSDASLEHFGVTTTFFRAVTGSWSAPMARTVRCTTIRSPTPSGSIRCSNA